jgi:hypothetical protein
MGKTKSTIRFKGELVKSSSWGVVLPKNVSVKFEGSEDLSTEGTINYLPFKSSIQSANINECILIFDKKMREAVGRDKNEVINIEITKLGEEQETRMPTDFSKALEADKTAKEMWVDITPVARRDWIFWIISAKHDETRKNRIEKACSKLSSGMRRVCCFGGINWLAKALPTNKK